MDILVLKHVELFENAEDFVTNYRYLSTLSSSALFAQQSSSTATSSVPARPSRTDDPKSYSCD